MTDDRMPLTFPEPSLIRMLVDLYLRTYNTYMTLLHRPTIERGIANGMHERHYGFGTLASPVTVHHTHRTHLPSQVHFS